VDGPRLWEGTASARRLGDRCARQGLRAVGEIRVEAGAIIKETDAVIIQGMGVVSGSRVGTGVIIKGSGFVGGSRVETGAIIKEAGLFEEASNRIGK